MLCTFQIGLKCIAFLQRSALLPFSEFLTGFIVPQNRFSLSGVTRMRRVYKYFVSLLFSLCTIAVGRKWPLPPKTKRFVDTFLWYYPFFRKYPDTVCNHVLGGVLQLEGGWSQGRAEGKGKHVVMEQFVVGGVSYICPCRFLSDILPWCFNLTEAIGD